ncbi:MAG: hypothetical protein J6E46_08480, partial [Faecalicoccus sp.]|nr:hypothetical protein [Faecalicoccus sp.]
MRFFEAFGLTFFNCFQLRTKITVTRSYITVIYNQILHCQAVLFNFKDKKYRAYLVPFCIQKAPPKRCLPVLYYCNCEVVFVHSEDASGRGAELT